MSEELQRQALAAVRFNSAETPDDVWGTSIFHVDGMHTRAEDRIRRSIDDAKRSSGPSPVGLTLQGRKGVGKTHLLGRVRRIVQQQGGYFFLIDLTTGRAFWSDVVRAVRTELWRKDEDGELQLTKLLQRLCDKANVPEAVAKPILGQATLTTDDLQVFIGALRRVDPLVAVECADTLRALALYAADDTDQQTLGKDYLSGIADDDKKRKRKAWGLPAEARPQRDLVTEISRVLAVTGPSVAAIDQLDSLITKAADVPAGETSGELATIADGLMQLRQTAQRTLTIVACLPTTWTRLRKAATDSFDDRFTETPILSVINDPRLGRALVEKWLGVVYQGVGFTPPHVTWPVAETAFGDEWRGYTPRQVLRRVQEHAEVCLYGEIRELKSFDEEPVEVVVEVPQPPGSEPGYFADFDRRFAELRKSADVNTVLSYHTEDDVMPDILQAVLRAWITEVGNDDKSWETEPPDGAGHLHAGLVRVLDEEDDVRERWMFRVFGPNQHGNRVLRRMRDAKAAAGISDGVRNRHLVLVYHGRKGWTGKTTERVYTDLDHVGSPRIEITKEDVRTFCALNQMLTKQSYELLNWLVARKPHEPDDRSAAVAA